MSAFLTPDDTHDLCVGRRARVLCSRGNGVHSLWAFFFGKAPLSFVPFLERFGAIICPPWLGSSRCWGSEETEIAGNRRWSLLTSLREEFFISRSSAADESKLLEEDVLSVTSSYHLLIQQEVLCWLMVGWWRQRGYFWAFSACLPRVCRAAGGYEACASVRLDLQWRHEKGGVARSRLDERSLSGITSQLPWASHFFQIFIVRSCKHGINHIQPASIGISMLIMLTSKGGASTDMRRCPLGVLASKK